MSEIDHYREGFEEAMRACGDCKLCYGKGYSSTIKGAGPEKGRGPVYLVPQITFCSCKRGDQLKDILSRHVDFTNA